MKEGRPSSATPYAAPPPQSTYHESNPHHSQRNSNQLTTIFCCDPLNNNGRAFMCCFVFAVLIFISIVILLIVLSSRIPKLRVNSVSLSNFSVNSSSLISGNWDVELAFRNPTPKSNVFYDQIEASVYYKSEALSLTTVPPFDQTTKKQTAVRVKFAASAAYVDEWVLNDINQERTSGSVNFNLMLFARVTLEPSWPARREMRFLEIHYGNLIVEIAANSGGGKLTSGSRHCKSRAYI